MPYCNEVPATTIPPREEGGPEYIDLNFDPADENSGIPPWDPNYVPPEPPVQDPLGRDAASRVDPNPNYDPNLPPSDIRR